MKNRSLLYTPAADIEKLRKSIDRSADVVIIDLEDSITEDSFTQSCKNVIEFLNFRDYEQRFWLRINSNRVEEQRKILELRNIESIVLPKVKSVQDIENFQNISGVDVKISALIESAEGVINAVEIAKLDSVIQLQLGEDDLRSDLLLLNKEENDSIRYARQRILFAAIAHTNGLPIGPISQNYKEIERYKEDCFKLRNQGFWGRTCIHPNQISVANEVFSVKKEEISRAEEIISSLGDKGVSVDFQGQMIDQAHLRWALKVKAQE